AQVRFGHRLSCTPRRKTMLPHWLTGLLHPRALRHRRTSPAARRRRAPHLQLESLEERCQPAGGATPNQQFVAQAYLDLWHRQVDPQGLAVWTGALDTGATRAAVVQGIATSTEYRNLVIDRDYALLLQRPVDPQGRNSWSGFLASGGTFEQLLANIAGST